MNTFTDQPASNLSPLNGGENVTGRMAGLQQSLAGALTLAV